MTCVKSRRQDKALVIPLGSSAKWTAKNKTDKVAKYIGINGNAFYSTLTRCKPTFSDIKASPMPKITANVSAQINKSSLFRLCEENSLQFHLTETCADENCLIAKQVFSLVQDLLDECSDMDPRIKGKLHWTGSASEGTKMWLPDEFDFVMELVELKDCCFTEDTLR